MVVPRAKADQLRLHLTKVNHDYVGFGPLARRLVDTTYEAMCAGIAQVRPGAGSKEAP